MGVGVFVRESLTDRRERCRVAGATSIIRWCFIQGIYRRRVATLRQLSV